MTPFLVYKFLVCRRKKASFYVNKL